MQQTNNNSDVEIGGTPPKTTWTVWPSRGEIIRQTCEALAKWGASIVIRSELHADLAALLPVNGFHHLIAVHIEPETGAILAKLQHNFDTGVPNPGYFQRGGFNEVVRNQISSILISSLANEQWNRVVVVGTSQIYSALRWVEDVIEHGCEPIP